MKIYVDADACPVISIIEELAENANIKVMLLCDTNHILSSNYSEVVVIGAGADAVDYALVNRLQHGDIFVTQDYGVAAMGLAKGARGIHQNGRIYSNDNIEELLMSRHVAAKARHSKKKKQHLKGPRKRTREDDERFRKQFQILINEVKTPQM